MTPDRREEIAAFLEASGEFDMARDVRAERTGRPPERDAAGFTPRQRELAALHLDLVASGGDLDRFIDDPRIPAGHDDPREFLHRIWKLAGRLDIRRCVASLES